MKQIFKLVDYVTGIIIAFAFIYECYSNKNINFQHWACIFLMVIMLDLKFGIRKKQ